MLRRHRQVVPAFTLVELLVVVGIMLVLAALAAAFMPRISSANRTANAANTVQSWLLQAKMRAKRDGLTTGLRLFADQNDFGSATECQWSQQPGPFVSATGGKLSAIPQWIPNPTGGGWLLTLQVQQQDATSVDFTNGQPDPSQWLVQPGDHFVFHDGSPWKIVSGDPQPPLPGIVWIVTNGATAGGAMPPPIPAGLEIAPTGNWKVLRQAKILVGESPLQLPRETVIDTYLTRAFALELPQAPAGSPLPPGKFIAYDLLFTPAGQMLGDINGGNASGLAILWVRNIDKRFDRSTPGMSYLMNQIAAPGGTDDQALVGVRCRTGEVLTADVSSSVSPFYFLMKP